MPPRYRMATLALGLLPGCVDAYYAKFNEGVCVRLQLPCCAIFPVYTYFEFTRTPNRLIDALLLASRAAYES
jgi:hypothetical protein